MGTAQHIFRRHRQLIFFAIGTVIVFGLFYALRSAVLPFAVGLALAYLLMPAVSWIEQKLPRKGKWTRTKRVSAILIIFIVILGLLGFFSYVLVTAVVKASLVILNNAPQYVSRSLFQLREWAEFIRQQFPPEMQQPVDQFLLDAGSAIGKATQNFFTTGISFIPSTFSLIVGFAALPIFLFYIMKDSERINEGLYSSLSPSAARYVRDVISIIEEVLGRYIRAQVMLGFIVGFFVFIGLLIIGIDFAPVLAVFAGVTELIPILGPWIGGAAAVIITLALVPEKVIWVILLYLLVQLFENNLLVPRIQGGYLRVHPAAALFLLVMGAYIAGFWGLILAVPLTATIIEIYKYVLREMKTEDAQNAGQP